MLASTDQVLLLVNETLTDIIVKRALVRIQLTVLFVTLAKLRMLLHSNVSVPPVSFWI